MRCEVYLKDYKDFVKINNRYYGGNQSWLSERNQISKFWSDRSCGVVAASNTLYYMTRLEHSRITKEEFVASALQLYKFITPRIYGIPTVGVMARGLEKHVKTRKIKIEQYPLTRPTNLLETAEYIKNGLNKDCPIMMVTWNTRISNLIYHWVTITGYYMTEAGEHYVTVSNYGEKEIINIDQWIREPSIYKGLLYFVIKDYY